MDHLGSFLRSIRPIKDGDTVDQLSYFYSVLAVSMSAFVVFGWSFFGNPLQCWFPPQFKGWWNEYARDYCFAQNTYFLQFTQVGEPQTYFDLVEKPVDIPHNIEEREEKMIGYYQWVPFVLALVACCFYAPVILWRAFCNQFGISVKAVVEMVHLPDTIGKENRQAKVAKIARFMDASIITKEALHGRTSGRQVILLYLFVKFLYLLNAVLQFLILQHFIGAKTFWWGVEVLDDLIHGRTWAETGNFPRVTYCDFDVRELANTHHHTVQCVLLINMLNEKIFVFLWFWYLFVAVITAANLIHWAVTSLSEGTSRKIVIGYLGISDKTLAQSPRARTLINQFLKETVRPDGVFLIRLVGFQGGDLVAAELTHALWNGFKRKHHLDDDQNGRIVPSAPVHLAASPYTGYPTLPRYEEAVTASPDKESGL